MKASYYIIIIILFVVAVASKKKITEFVINPPEQTVSDVRERDLVDTTISSSSILKEYYKFYHNTQIKRFHGPSLAYR